MECKLNYAAWAVGFMFIVSVPSVKSLCNVGWYEYGSSCYYITSTRRNYDTLVTYCNTNNATMWVPHDQNETAWLNTIFERGPRILYWTGLKALNRRWTWSDGTPYNKNNVNWYRGQEGNPSDANKGCGGVYGYSPNTGQIEAHRCGEGWGGVCIRSNDWLDLCNRNDNWLYQDGRCFKFFDTPMPWSAARQTCQDNQGDLTIFRENYQLNILSDLVTCLTTDNMLWIGLSDTVTPHTWQWINNDTVRFNRWLINKIIVNGSTCAAADPTSSWAWRPFTCDNSFKFVCNRTVGECPSGWLVNRDRCYQPNVVASVQKTWFDAQKYCNAMGSRLLVIDSAVEQQYISETMRTLRVDRAWLAFSDAQKSDELRWVNGQLVQNSSTYQNWDSNFPQLDKSRFDCGMLVQGPRDAKWSNAYCFNNLAFFCQMKITTQPNINPTQAPVSGHCKDGWQYFNSKCYYFGPTGNQSMKSWGEALQFCASSGIGYHGNLVIINDPYEMSYVTVQQSAIVTAWIGMKYNLGNKQLEWVDGTVPGQNMINETNFHPGEPDDLDNGQECIQIIGGQRDYTGAWDDGNCSMTQGFICEMDSFPGASPPPSTALAPQMWSSQCGPHWVYSAVDNFCYQVMLNAPRTWHDARRDCINLGGDLASISGQKEQNFIQGLLSGWVMSGVQVDLWLGATDETQEGGWHWMDNAPFRYLNWHPGEPNNQNLGGVPEDCAEIVPSWNYQWNDLRCDSERNYICKKNAILPTSTPPPGATVNPQSVDCPGVPMISGNYSIIDDTAFASSDPRDTQHQKSNSRLYPGSQGAWSAKINDGNQYISVHFYNTLVVKGIMTAGRENIDEWVTSYKIQFKGTYFGEFITYQDPPGTDKIFAGNTDASSSVTNMLLFPFEAITVQLVPVQWHNGISLRWEVLGCIEESCSPEYAVSGPVIAKDENIIASTEQDILHRATSARLHSIYPQSIPACWKPSNMDANQWIQVKLEKTMNIRGITIRGNPDDQEWVTSYRMKYSFSDTNSLTYYQEPYNKIMTLPGNTDNVTPSTYMLKAHLKAVYIRIIPQTWHQAIAMNFDILVCSTGCKGVPLITGSDGPKIPDDQITASTSINDRHSPSRARLNQPSQGSYGGAWIPQFNDRGMYLQVDFGFMVYVESIATQGAFDTMDWVTNYTLSYSGDGVTWTAYFGLSFKPMLFEGNWDNNSVRKHFLLIPFIARYVRLLPVSFHNMVAVRLEIYGCPGSDSGLKIGCYADMADKHDLPFEPLTDPQVGMWPPMCVNHCFRSGYYYAGLQNQYQCFCGNSYGTYGPATDCNLKCVPQDGFTCGGPSSNMVYTTGLTPQFKVCPSFWKSYNERCYILLLDKRSWFDARADCQKVGADLASPNNQPEQDFIYSLVQYGNGSNAWVGFNDMQTENFFVWSDGRQVQYTNWGLNQPSHIQNDGQDCVFMNATTAGWQDTSCDISNMYVCQMDKRATDVPPVTSPPRGCPPDWVAYMGSCYLLADAPKNWVDGRTMCLTLGGWLVIVNDQSEQAYLSSLTATRSQTYWTSVNDQQHYGTWTIFHQSTYQYLTYTNWGKGQPATLGHCAYMGSGNTSGLWFTAPCASNRGILCESNRLGFTTPTPPARTTTQPPCQSGTIQTDTGCYQVNIQPSKNQLTWSEAMTYCMLRGSNLASFHSDADLNVVWRQGLVGTTNNFWIGLNDRNAEGGYAWSDNTPSGYFNWNNNEPNDWHDSEDCVEMMVTTGKWNDQNCNSRMNWICMAPRGHVIQQFVTHPAPTGQISTQCGTDQQWTLFNNFCYYANDGNGNQGLSWRQARLTCQKSGGDLASITSHTEQDFITRSLIQNISDSFVWIGLNELNVNTGYRWSDGSQVVYSNWARGEPNDYGGAEDCVQMTSRNGLWNDEHCSHQFAYVCKKRLGAAPTPPVPTIPGPGNCPSGFSLYNNKCFMINTQPANWTTALANCKSAGYTLASIHDVGENAFLTTMLATVSLSPWIGLHKDGSQTMTWISNDDVTYTNFAWSEPNGGTNDQCIQMLGYPAQAGQWNDVNCASQLGYICQTYKNPQITTSEPKPNICDVRQNQKQFLDACYFFIQQPLTWQAANDACIKQGGGYLTSINSVYEQAFIYLMMLQSSAGPLWIGLNDIQSSGVYSWKDGWPVLYTNWATGEPLRGPGEGCVMFNTSGHWVDTLCNLTLPTVCKISSATPPMSPPPPDGRCPFGWYPHIGKCYFFGLNQPQSAIDASFYCQHRQASLVSIHNSSENAYLVAKMIGLAHQGQSFWTSLHKSLDSGFQWLDGSPLQYTNWRPGEPSTRGWAGNDENCAEVFISDGKWNDEDCNSKRNFICEMPIVVDTSQLPPGSGPPIINIPTPIRTPSTLPTQLVPTLSKRPGNATPPPPGSPASTSTTMAPGSVGSSRSPTGNHPSSTLPTSFNSKGPNTNTQAQKTANNTNKMSPGAMAGIIIAVVVVVLAIVGGLVFWRKKLTQGTQHLSSDREGFENQSYMTAQYDNSAEERSGISMRTVSESDG